MAEQDWLAPAAAPSPSPYYNVTQTASSGAPAYELRPLTLGELLDRTFSLYRSRFWLFAGIASVAAVVELLAAGTGRILLHHYTRNQASIVTGGLIVAYAAAFIYFFVYCVTQAATCFAMSEVYLGNPTSIGASLRDVRAKWYAWIGIAIWQSWSLMWAPLALLIPFFVVAGFAVTRGRNLGLIGLMTALIFAGIGAFVYGGIAYIRNSLAIPAKVVEGLTVRKSMRRSKTLAKGAKGRIFVLLLILWALSLVAGMLAVPFGIVMASPVGKHIFAEVSVLLIGFVTRTVIPPVLSIGLCMIYFDQRVRTEAFDLDVLLGPEQASPHPATPDLGIGMDADPAVASGEIQANAPLV